MVIFSHVNKKTQAPVEEETKKETVKDKKSLTEEIEEKNK